MHEEKERRDYTKQSKHDERYEMDDPVIEDPREPIRYAGKTRPSSSIAPLRVQPKDLARSLHPVLCPGVTGIEQKGFEPTSYCPIDGASRVSHL